jgi:hypothetical protein
MDEQTNQDDDVARLVARDFLFLGKIVDAGGTLQSLDAAAEGKTVEEANSLAMSLERRGLLITAYAPPDKTERGLTCNATDLTKRFVADERKAIQKEKDKALDASDRIRKRTMQVRVATDAENRRLGLPEMRIEGSNKDFSERYSMVELERNKIYRKHLERKQLTEVLSKVGQVLEPRTAPQKVHIVADDTKKQEKKRSWWIIILLGTGLFVWGAIKAGGESRLGDWFWNKVDEIRASHKSSTQPASAASPSQR